MNFVVADAIYSQDPGTGVVTTTLHVLDPQRYVTDVEYKEKEGPGDWETNWQGPSDSDDPWDGVSGTIGSSQTLTRTEDTQLQENHNSAINWRVKWTDSSGFDHEILGGRSFDLDLVPEFQGALQLIGDEVYFTYEGDEDLGSIRWASSKSAMPNAEDVDGDSGTGTGAGTVHTGQESDGFLVDTLVQGEVLYFRARGYENGDGTGKSNAPTRDITRQVEYPEADLNRPVVSPNYSQNDGTAECALTLIDPNSQITRVGFAKKPDSGGFGSFTYDSSEPFDTTETVAIVEKHNVAIKWEVDYTDNDGNTQTLRGAHTFDIDVIPAFSAGLHLDGDEVLLSYEGDEDLASIRYATSTSSMPTDADVAAGTVYPGGGGTSREADGISIHTGLGDKETLYCRVRGYSEADAAGNASNQDVQRRVTLNPGSVTPDVAVDVSQSGNTGTLSLTISDPQSRVNATSFKTKSGGGDFDASTDPTTWSGYDNTDPFDTAENVGLSEAHTSYIAWAVRYEDADGNNQWIRSTQPFDLDVIPNVFINSIDFQDDGTATLSFSCDADCSSPFGYATAAVGSAPANPTTSDTALGSRNGTVSLGVVVNVGEKVFVKATGHDGSSLGSETAVAEKTRGTGGSGSGVTPTCEIVFKPGSSDDSQREFRIDGSPGPEGGIQDDLEGRWQVNSSVVDGDWSAWATLSSLWDITITSWTSTDFFIAEVRDTSVGSAPDHPKNRDYKPMVETDEQMGGAPGVTVTDTDPGESTSTNKETGHIWAVYN
jgi:hypothetical protein